MTWVIMASRLLVSSNRPRAKSRSTCGEGKGEKGTSSRGVEGSMSIVCPRATC